MNEFNKYGFDVYDSWMEQNNQIHKDQSEISRMSYNLEP